MFKADTAAFLKGVKGAPERLKKRFRVRVMRVCAFTHDKVTGTTPVWTGTALRSYTWSAGSPSMSVKGDPGGVATGHTNAMPIGVEPRRPMAQSEADASLLGLSFTNPYQHFYLNNNTDHIGGLEYGNYPLPPLRQRSPAGMFRVTVTAIHARLQAGAL